MMSAVELKRSVIANPEQWEIPFMEFVDDFRRERDAAKISESFPLSDERFDALLASSIEYLCREQHITPPTWLERVPACRKPWFVAGIESIKAIALVESPVEFRLRKIFVLENFLSRA